MAIKRTINLGILLVNEDEDEVVNEEDGRVRTILNDENDDDDDGDGADDDHDDDDDDDIGDGDVITIAVSVSVSTSAAIVALTVLDSARSPD